MAQEDSFLQYPRKALNDALRDARQAFKTELGIIRHFTGGSGKRESADRRLARIDASQGRDAAANQAELARVVADERRPEKASIYESFRGLGYDSTQSQYMEAFQRTQLLGDIMQKARDVMSQKGEFHPGEFAGVVFEQLAYGIFAANESQKGNLVLSPDATFAFYRDIVYPEGEEVEWDFNREILHDDVRSSYVPDGFVIDANGKIVNIVEYRPITDGIRRKLERAPGLIEKLRSKGLLSGEETPQVVFVTLKGKEVPNLGENINIQLTNFTTKQFRSAIEPLLVQTGNVSTRSRTKRPPNREGEST